jgi:hypothetical protein
MTRSLNRMTLDPRTVRKLRFEIARNRCDIDRHVFKCVQEDVDERLYSTVGMRIQNRIVFPVELRVYKKRVNWAR